MGWRGLAGATAAVGILAFAAHALPTSAAWAASEPVAGNDFSSVSLVVPDAPTAQTVCDAGGASVRVAWTPVGGARGYDVLRRSHQHDPYAAIGSVDDDAGDSYFDDDVVEKKTYWYQVRAVAGTWTSTSADVEIKIEKC